MNNGNPDYVTIADSTSFKCKTSILGNPVADGVLKKCKNSCSTKIPKQFLEIIRNAFV